MLTVLHKHSSLVGQFVVDKSVDWLTTQSMYGLKNKDTHLKSETFDAPPFSTVLLGSISH